MCAHWPKPRAIEKSFGIAVLNIATQALDQCATECDILLDAGGVVALKLRLDGPRVGDAGHRFMAGGHDIDQSKLDALRGILEQLQGFSSSLLK
ncbi:MAG: hypothetical protein KGP28_01645 [Bdellovibrionales bacterium]|nr:hypothetical protein [Bdellovibrionales bacterium]